MFIVGKIFKPFNYQRTTRGKFGMPVMFSFIHDLESLGRISENL